jgi:hypothetical protein
MPADNIPEIRARKVGEILDASFKLLFKNVKTLFPFTAWIVFPFQILSAAVVAFSGPSVAKTLTDWSTEVQANPGKPLVFPTFTSGQIGGVAVGLLLSVLSMFFLQAALTAFIGQLVLERTVNRKEALRIAVRRSPYLLATSILTGLMLGVVVGVSALSVVVLKAIGILVVLVAMVVAIWFFIRLGISYPPIVLENAGPVTALRRSFRLTSGSFWKVLGTLLIGGVISGVAASSIQAALAQLLQRLGGSNKAFEFLWSAISGTIATAITAPLGAAMTVFLYFDLRVRKEGFDLQRLADDLLRQSSQNEPTAN